MENWVDFKAIKAAVSITAVLDRYGVSGLRKHGAELRGKCPIHKGDGAEAFHVNTEKNAFHCFSCNAKGNVLDFVAVMEKCSVRDAGLKLQQWFGLAVGDDPPVTAATSGRLELTREEVVGEADIKNKPLGFQLKGVDYRHAYLAGRGISPETAEYFGVGFFSGKGSMAGRIVIPIHNAGGELVAYAGRAIDGTEPRYKLPAGFHKSAELYNLNRAMSGQHRGLIVVEGYFAAMRVHQAGYPFVVALMGSTLSAEQEHLLVAHADQVLIMLDGDEAGRQGTDDLLVRLGRKVWMKAISLPDGQQPDDLTPDELSSLLQN
jgi:DNA primase